MKREPENERPMRYTTERKRSKKVADYFSILSHARMAILPLLQLSLSHSCYSEIHLCLAKQIADTGSSKLWIGSLGQVELLTSEGSESRGGEERARQKEKQQKSLL